MDKFFCVKKKGGCGNATPFQNPPALQVVESFSFKLTIHLIKELCNCTSFQNPPALQVVESFSFKPTIHLIKKRRVIARLFKIH